jgi:uncharacterized repeat protein (TIGR03803 family)
MTMNPEHRRSPRIVPAALSFNLRLSALAVIVGCVLIIGMMQPAQAQTFTVLHTFTGPDGLSPYSGVVMDGAGSLYGTTYGGGATGNGTVYQLRRNGTGYIHHQLHAFTGGSDGDQPYGGVALGQYGVLYGTSNGGTNDSGIVFSLQQPFSFCRSVSCPWFRNVLYDLASGGNAAPLYGQPALDAAGNIYATSVFGGSNEYGTVYEVSRSGSGWTGTTLYFFQAGGDPAYPTHNVILDSLGNLYGTTGGGGDYGQGAVFELERSGSGWVEQVLVSFGAPGTCAGYTLSGLIMDSAGNLYGGTTGDGTSACVFELSPSAHGWQFSVLYTFTISNGGQGPVGNLAMGSNGTLYGTTQGLGANGLGNIFRLSPSGSGWIYTDLYDFSNHGDGEYPTGDLTIDSNGNIYGTNIGDATGHGVVWKLTP